VKRFSHYINLCSINYRGGSLQCLKLIWEALAFVSIVKALQAGHLNSGRFISLMLKKRIAIIGAGGTGACTALELAQRGHTIDLYERTPRAVSQASFVNEGKIHLGFIYAKDPTLKTAYQMIEGALQFEENLKRWIPFSAKDIVSTPFYYCVHRGSLMSSDQLAHHYGNCVARYREVSNVTGRDYLGLGMGSHFERLKETEYPGRLNPDYFSAVFRTTEFAVDPRPIAEALRHALLAEPRINLRLQHHVLGIQEKNRGGFSIKFQCNGAEFEEFSSDVVNTSWYQRLPIDRTMGIVPSDKWLHRYKFGSRIEIPLIKEEIPSCSCVLGPFGDIVNFGVRGIFLSWYPTGRTGMSTDETPPNWHDSFTSSEMYAVFKKSFEELKKRFGVLNSLNVDESLVDSNGGVIYALGWTDVDDQNSKLHDRFEIGIQSKGRYHSVDTGKYSLVPYWGLRVADRVEGLRS